MSEEKRKINMAPHLHYNEAWIIDRWRTKYRYGEMTIIVKDGIPIQIRKAIIIDSPQDEAKQIKP
jgi:hypothetical protein